MTDAEKAALLEYFERLSRYAAPADRHYYAALTRALAEPRLTKRDVREAVDAAFSGMSQSLTREEQHFARQAMSHYHRALYDHLARPHVDFRALDEARMEPQPGVERELDMIIEAFRTYLHHGRGSKAEAGIPVSENCTPAARDRWNLEYAVLEQGRWWPRLEPFERQSDAEAVAKEQHYRSDVACIRVTGPHLHQVPA